LLYQPALIHHKIIPLKNHLFLFLVAGSAVFFSCKKNDLAVNNVLPVPTPGPGLSTDALKDSALLYSRDIYLWYNQIPSTFNAKSYESVDKVMTAIRQYSTEPGFSGAVDRWSFAINQQQWDNVSSGVSGDFGLSVFFRTEGDLRVKHVEPKSPAGLAGVRRGWRITAINGNSNITTGNANYIIQQVYQVASAGFTFLKPDNSTVTLNFNAAAYNENPIILDTIYSIGGKNIGYFAFNSFLGDTSSLYNEFSRIFNKFSANNIQDLVVDLRYNGGGYVSVQQKLANWLAPSSANGQIMMKQIFNDKYTSYNSTDNFQKLGSLNLPRLFFIVSSSTASASELLINNLRPYQDVQLIGPSKTYGKPVGYFPIPVGSWYIFPVSFRSTNKNGQGNYFDGIALNSQAADGLDKDWGDIYETSLQKVLGYITTGAYPSQSINTITQQQQPAVREGNIILDQPGFKGAVDTRRMKK
jgi:carboxyl-terminal processing protease